MRIASTRAGLRQKARPIIAASRRPRPPAGTRQATPRQPLYRELPFTTRSAPWPRRQLPVRSPLPGRALAAALGAGPQEALAAVTGALDRHLDPQALLLADSGTSALTLALRMVLADGGRRCIAVPAFCCYDIATAVVGAGARALVYDLDPRTLEPDLASLEQVLRDRVDAVVVAHLYGYPVDVPRVQSLTSSYGATLVEDAAQGSGGTIHGRKLGTLGDLGILSFGRGKGVTGGGGGALLANTPRWKTGVGDLGRTMSAAQGGWRSMLGLLAQWLLGRPAWYWLPASLPFLGLGETHYRPPRAPRTMSAQAARVLTVTLEGASAELAARTANAVRLQMALGRQPEWETIGVGPAAAPGYLRLPVLKPLGELPGDQLAAGAKLGVVPSYPTTLLQVPAFRDVADRLDRPMPGAEELARRLLTFPTHSMVTAGDLERLERWADGIGSR